MFAALQAQAAPQLSAGYRLVASDAAVCAPMLEFLNRKPGVQPAGLAAGISAWVNPASEGVEPKAFRVGSELRSLNAAPSVDFDNDGLPDLVFWEQSEDHYYGGTIFYLLPGNADPAEAAVTSAALPLEALRMFPCQFDPSVASVRDCPPLSQKADEAAVKVAVAGKSVSFRVRYTSMTALQFDHKTYLLLTSASQDTAHAAALIEPQGKLKFAPRCLFMGPHS